MAGMATKSLGLEEGKGIRFYDFPDIKNNKAFIEEWYSEVNRLGFSEKESAALVEEEEGISWSATRSGRCLWWRRR